MVTSYLQLTMQNPCNAQIVAKDGDVLSCHWSGQILSKEQLLIKRLSGHNQNQRYGIWLSQVRQMLIGVVTASA